MSKERDKIERRRQVARSRKMRADTREKPAKPPVVKKKEEKTEMRDVYIAVGIVAVIIVAFVLLYQFTVNRPPKTSQPPAPASSEVIDIITMIFKAQYLTDARGRKNSVIIPIGHWRKILRDLEDLDDIRAFDAAKTGSQETIPFEQAVREIQEGHGE